MEAPAFMARVSASDRILRFSAGGCFSSKANMAHAPQEIRTFFVTSVTNTRHAFFKNADAAELFIDTLHFYRSQGKFELHEP